MFEKDISALNFLFCYCDREGLDEMENLRLSPKLKFDRMYHMSTVLLVMDGVDISEMSEGTSDGGGNHLVFVGLFRSLLLALLALGSWVSPTLEAWENGRQMFPLMVWN